MSWAQGFERASKHVPLTGNLRYCMYHAYQASCTKAYGNLNQWYLHHDIAPYTLWLQILMTIAQITVYTNMCKVIIGALPLTLASTLLMQYTE